MKRIIHLFVFMMLMLSLPQLLVAQPPSRGRAMEMLIAGDNFLQMLDIERAIEHYSSAISLDPQFADAYMKRANAYAIAGRGSEAQADYNMAVNINPYIDYLYDTRAKIKVMVADFKGLLIDVENPTLISHADVTQGYIFSELRAIFPNELSQMDSLIATDSATSQHFAKRAIARWEAEDVSGAIDDANQALELNPTNALAYNVLGLLQIEEERYAAALASFEAAVKIDENYAGALHNMGRAHNLLGNPGRALEFMNRAIALDTSYALAYFSRAMVYKGLGNTHAAIADYDRVVAIYPEFADAYFSRGFARKMLGDFGGAIRDYDRAILLNPNEPSQYNNRGILRVLADDYAGAARDFRTAISLQPEYAIVYHNFGMSLIMNHSRMEGCGYLQTSIEQGFISGQDQYKYFCTH